jgi:ABC-type Fe3+/spermidine/putrescine transport system ATPase subunit
MSYLQIRNLEKKFENFTLKIENIDIQKGGFFGILGHSGAGKSTLLNVLCGFENPDSGDILIAGNSILSKKPHERGIAYVFQNALLFEGLSVYENLVYLLKAKSLPVKEELIQDALAECEVLHVKNRDVKTLSGGERQRVALAMALMMEAKLLLLDEPFSNLDTALKIKMRIFLKKLLARHNITAIMVTHDKDDAFLLFDEMILIENGNILQSGTPKHIYENPQTLSVAKYFGFENIFTLQEAKEKFALNFNTMSQKILLIPYHAISLGGDLVQELSQKVYVEGRYKIECTSGLVFFSLEDIAGKFVIEIQKEKCSLFEDEYSF